MTISQNVHTTLFTFSLLCIRKAERAKATALNDGNKKKEVDAERSCKPERTFKDLSPLWPLKIVRNL